MDRKDIAIAVLVIILIGPLIVTGYTIQQQSAGVGGGGGISPVELQRAPCSYIISLEGTIPIANPGTGASRIRATTGEDIGAFLQSLTTSGSQKFCFDPGTYTVTSAVTFSSGKTAIQGAGKSKTIFNLPVTYAGDLFTISGLSYFEARDFTVQGNAFSPFPTETAQNAGTIIHSVDSAQTKTLITNVEFINVISPWTAESGGSDLVFCGNFLENVATGPTVYANGGTIARVLICDNVILNSRDDAIAIIGNGQASPPHNTTQVNVVNNVIMKADTNYGNLAGAAIKIDFGTAVSRDLAMVIVANNNLRTHNAGTQGGGSNETGITISGTPYQGYSSSIPALQITGNILWGFTTGISIAGNTQTYLSRINNNIITYARWRGISVQAQRYTEFEHNTIQSDPNVAANTFGIVLSGNSNNILFAFNDFHGFDSSYAIFIPSGLTLSNIIFEWNDFSDIGNLVASLGSSGTIFKYNRNYATEASGGTNVADGGTISHGLIATPVFVTATCSIASQMCSVTALAATTFTVAIKTDAGAAGTTQTVYWYAQTWTNP